jgi:surface protein
MEFKPATKLELQNAIDDWINGSWEGEDINNWNTSLIEDMSYLFDSKKTFNSDISNWDVSKVTNMYRMFWNAQSFNQDLSKWITNSVTNMGWMFVLCFGFNKPLENWDTSSVTDMAGMFAYARNFNKPLDSWHTKNVTSMFYMFYDASSFNQSLENWDTSSVTRMSHMFYKAASFNQSLDGWNTSSVIRMDYMFYKAASFNQSLDGWNTSSVTNMSYMFYAAASFNQNINSHLVERELDQNYIAWDTSNVKDMRSMFDSAKSFNRPISNWNVSNVTNMSYMFRGCINLGKLDGGFEGDLFRLDGSVVDFGLTGDDLYNAWTPKKCRNMSNMFSGCTWFNSLVKNWSTTSVTTMRDMFSDCLEFNQDVNSDVLFYDNILDLLYDRSTLENSNSAILNYVGIFSVIYEYLTDGEEFSFKKGDLIYVEVDSQASYFKFIGDNSITMKKEFDISWAEKWENLNSLNWQEFSRQESWDVSSVKDMSSMFRSCFKFNKSLSEWNTSSVTNMSYMFHMEDTTLVEHFLSQDREALAPLRKLEANPIREFSSFQGLGVENFKTGKVKYMQNMFANCQNFYNIIDYSPIEQNRTWGRWEDEDYWVTRSLLNAENMFQNTGIDFICSNIITNSITHMNSMFDGCENILNVDFSRWNLFSLREPFGGQDTNIFGGDWSSSVLLKDSQGYTNSISFLSLHPNTFDFLLGEGEGNDYWVWPPLKDEAFKAKEYEPQSVFSTTFRFNAYRREYFNINNIDPFRQDLPALTYIDQIDYMSLYYDWKLDDNGISCSFNHRYGPYARTMIKYWIAVWQFQKQCDAAGQTWIAKGFKDYCLAYVGHPSGWDLSGVDDLSFLFVWTESDQENFQKFHDDEQYYEPIASEDVNGSKSSKRSQHTKETTLNLNMDSDGQGKFIRYFKEENSEGFEWKNIWGDHEGDTNSFLSIKQLIFDEYGYAGPWMLYTYLRILGIKAWYPEVHEDNHPLSVPEDFMNYLEFLDGGTAPSIFSLQESLEIKNPLVINDFNEDISMWDTSDVTNMKGTFWGAEHFSGDISTWDTSKVTDMSFMFREALNFNGSKEIKLSNKFNVKIIDSGIIPIFADDENGTNATFAGDGQEYITFYKWTGSVPTSVPEELNYVKYTGERDSSGRFTLLFADDESGTNATFTFNNQEYVNLYEWRGSAPTSVPEGLNYIKYTGSKSIIEIDLLRDDPANGIVPAFSHKDMEKLFVSNLTTLFDGQKVFAELNFIDESLKHLSGVFECIIKEEILIRRLDFYLKIEFSDPLIMSQINNEAEVEIKLISEQVHIGLWDTSMVTSMQEIFVNCPNLKCNLTRWDTSKVENMSAAFCIVGDRGSMNKMSMDTLFDLNANQKFYNSELSNNLVNEIIGTEGDRFKKMVAPNIWSSVYGWDTSNVRDMSCMFAGRKYLEFDFLDFSVESLEAATCMFESCELFDTDLPPPTQYSVSEYNVPGALKNCHKFNSSLGFLFGPVNVGQTINFNMSSLLEGCSLFNQDLSQLNTSYTLFWYNTFKGCSSLDQPLLFDMSGANPEEKPITEYDLARIIDISDTKLSIKNYDKTLVNFEERVENARRDTEHKGGINIRLNAGNLKYSRIGYEGRKSLIDEYNWEIEDGGSCVFMPLSKGALVAAIKATLNNSSVSYGPMSHWDTYYITDMSRLFSSAQFMEEGMLENDTYDMLGGYEISDLDLLKNFNQDISYWDTTNVTSMDAMFTNCLEFNQNLNTVRVVARDAQTSEVIFSYDAWDVSNVTSMNGMFLLSNNFNRNLDRWNVSSVTDMTLMFAFTDSFNGNIEDWNVGSVKSMHAMFYWALIFNRNIGNWDVSSVTDMESMFGDAFDFNQNLSSWNTSMVTSMQTMFFVDSSIFGGLPSRNSVLQSFQFFNIKSLNSYEGDVNVGLRSFINEENIDQGTYDDLLVSWANENAPRDIFFSVGDQTKYSSTGNRARDFLIDQKNWNILDGGFDPKIILRSNLTGGDNDLSLPEFVVDKNYAIYSPRVSGRRFFKKNNLAQEGTFDKFPNFNGVFNYKNLNSAISSHYQEDVSSLYEYHYPLVMEFSGSDIEGVTCLMRDVWMFNFDEINQKTVTYCDPEFYIKFDIGSSLLSYNSFLYRDVYHRQLGLMNFGPPDFGPPVKSDNRYIGEEGIWIYLHSSVDEISQINENLGWCWFGRKFINTNLMDSRFWFARSENISDNSWNNINDAGYMIDGECVLFWSAVKSSWFSMIFVGSRDGVISQGKVFVASIDGASFYDQNNVSGANHRSVNYYMLRLEDLPPPSPDILPLTPPPPTPDTSPSLDE